jgi:hypothetical protein
MNFNVRCHDPQFELVIKVRTWLSHDKGYKLEMLRPKYDMLQTCSQGMT